MFVHQEGTNDCIECWIELNQINFIKPQYYNGEISYYKLYLVSDSNPVSITQETFDKIMAEKGMI